MEMTLESMQEKLARYIEERDGYTLRRQRLTELFSTVTDQARREKIRANMAILDNEVTGCNEWIRTLTSHIKHYNS